MPILFLKVVLYDLKQSEKRSCASQNSFVYLRSEIWTCDLDIRFTRVYTPYTKNRERDVLQFAEPDESVLYMSECLRVMERE